MKENGQNESPEDRRSNDASESTRPAPNPMDSPSVDVVPADLSVVQGEAAESHSGSYIGRYQIIRRLGQGGFGTVYLARDQELERLVAIKLPHLSRMQNSSFRTEFLAEARTLAKLDHPAIVPIFDCGVISDGRCFVVSKYIEGRDLARVLVQGPIEPTEVVRLMIDVADALQHVHRCGIIHRDIKPANLLLGHDGRVYVADFGLAQRETHGNQATRFAGTPSYMSPEQVRGEGHRIDGRSDLFSLGVTMYELLTGERPFSRGTAEEVFHRVLTVEPFPPDQLNGRVPIELSRICMKLMAKLSSQRYADAGVLAADLRDWKASAGPDPGELNIARATADGTTIVPSENLMTATRTASSGTVVPRGLRAFTRADAGFYPDLLPGVRDRDGLPVIIGHWKHWVTQREDAPELHTAGVIFGPTGCGKSSLVRAGILPALPDSCLTAFVDASADQTERQLMAAVDRRCHERLSGDLTDQLTAIRTGSGLRKGQSLLIVIDQFEQWLHAHPDPQETPLLRALRQCDGIRLQCLLLIRDDFWLALSRFMEVLEVPLQLGRNATLIDLFDRNHARRVLAEFGRGYGQLPADPAALSKDHQRFVEGAVDSLSTDGKVIPVHLALFAEMVKSREWVPATLRQLGGASGIGARFLTESFSTSSSPAHQRAYEEPARRILEALLPDPLTEIKASRRSRTELLEVSGFKDDPTRFSALMVILETDLKLITRADVVGRSRSESSGTDSISATHSLSLRDTGKQHEPQSSELAGSPTGTPGSTGSIASQPASQSLSGSEQSAWQLSHDFLVPSVREWLMAMRRESLQGRIRQRLAEQARYWNFDQDARHLPGPIEWCLMRCLIPRLQMSTVEQQLLAAADRRVLRTVGLVAASLFVLAWTWNRFKTQAETQARIAQLATSVPDEVTHLINELQTFGTPAQSAIDSAAKSAEEDSRERFLYQLASLNWSQEARDNVFDYAIHHADIADVPVAGTALAPFAEQLIPTCWKIIENRTPPKSGQTFSDIERFRALQLLAGFPQSMDSEAEQRWKSSQKDIVTLVLAACSQNPNQYAIIETSLEPIRQRLLPNLTKWIGEEQKDVAASFALALVIGYTKDNMAQRTDLLLDASDWQVERLLSSSARLDDSVLWKAVSTPPVDSASDSDLLRHAHRRSMAASILLTSAEQTGKQTEELNALWTDLSFSSDMTSRTYLIRFLPERHFPLSAVARRLSTESDAGILAALLLIAGDYPDQEVDAIPELTASAGRLYHSHPNAAVHAAAEWVLRQWGQTQTLNALPISPPGDPASESQRQQWKRIPQGLTLVEVDGSKASGVGRRFLISSTEVTRDQMHAFNPSHYVNPKFSPTSDSPASVVRWNDAVNYCNWLSSKEALPLYYPETLEEQNAWTSTAESLQGTGYRLPTDAEWEFASLAGAITDSNFGRDPLQVDRYGWYEANHSKYLFTTGQSDVVDEDESSFIFAKPVGLLRPNEYGLFDIYGNVEEWCDDRGQTAESERAIRGGGSRSYRKILNSRRTGSLLPASQFDSMGFRIVRTVR